jgi:phosphoglycolate phosphatase
MILPMDAHAPPNHDRPHPLYLIWDWNGTLFDDVDACVEAINRMIQRRGLPHLETERYRELFQFPVKEYYRLLGFDLAHEDWDAMAREFHAEYAQTAADTDLRAGARDVIRQLSTLRMGMSILSASERKVLMRSLRGVQLEHCFEHIYALDDLYAASKTEVGRQLLKTLGHAPERVWIVGDTTHDHEVALSLGCRCVLVTDGHQCRQRLERCGVPVLESLLEIPNFLLAATRDLP